MITRLLILVAAAMLVPGREQQIGDFTRAPLEHEITLLERPFIVRAVRGRVSVLRDHEALLTDVLVEIQGPGKNRRIRRATSDNEGRFMINHVPSGTYRFKTTLSRWRSVMVDITVSAGAPKDREILLEMHPGT